MARRFIVTAILSASVCATAASLAATRPYLVPEGPSALPVAQAKVDFVRDVQPIFRQHCFGCHGPTQQMNGFRLDRRKDAMRGGTVAVIGPGSSQSSRVYLRLVGNDFGPQMPPSGPLGAAQIQTIKDWIDQGAVWPDEASGEVAAPLPDPDATRLVNAIRRGDLSTFRAALKAAPKAAALKGPGGMTPLMAATLYADVGTMKMLLENGADPNIRNDAGATALMWAVSSLEKTQLLVEHGADVNARSDDRRTPLMIAAGLHGGGAVVKLLLDRGADVNATATGLFSQTNPLLEAIFAGDEANFRLLVDRGAKAAEVMPFGGMLAFHSGCRSCESVMAGAPPPLLGVVAAMSGPPLSDARAVSVLLDRGADPNAKDLQGRSLLMLAASSDALPIESVRALLQKGADVNYRTPQGDTALSLAMQRGQTPIVELLMKAGATPGDAPTAAPTPSPAPSARAAVERSIPLLQKSDVTFMKKSGCVSCHNNSLSAMAVATARRRGITVNREIASGQAKAIGAYLESWRDRVLQGNGIPGDADTISYLLLGLAAESYAADAATDAMAVFLKYKQMPDGRWRILAHRPPIESSDIQVTAATMRALQIYAPQGQRIEYQRAIDRAAKWLKTARPHNTEDRAFQLLGLLWAEEPDRQIIQTAAKGLLAAQRPDGGWAQIPSLPSDAYATGQALVALAETNAVPVSDPAFQRGVQYLLKNQLADGSWFVPTRAIPIQPLFDADFPHGKHAFISAAATGWATMALSMATATN